MRVSISRFVGKLLIALYICLLLLLYTIQNHYSDDGRSLSASQGARRISEAEELLHSTADLGNGDYVTIYGMPRKEIKSISNNRNSSRKKLFLFSGEIGPAHLSGCPEYNCEITTDPRHLEESDAVVFHNSFGSGQTKNRKPNQFYVFFTQESPLHMSVGEPMRRNFFNLTLGFRRDADIPCPYGYIVQRKKPLPALPQDLMGVIKKKDRPVAWFVSNCGAPSGRSEYVNELKKYIDVDIYGACGTMSCPKGGDDCNDLLEKRYKFYLAFENSLCKDYATEKFWEKMTLNIVTIVLKRSIVATAAPPDSFIAADDFESPRAMAEYLKKLDENDELYLKHFQWRIQYKAVFLNGRDHGLVERPWCFCRLCERVQEKPVQPQTYENIDKWWTQDAQCDGELVARLLAGKEEKREPAADHVGS